MSSLSAVVFDFDGIILDSETVEFESHRRIYERCGVVLTPDEWCAQIGLWNDTDEQRWHARLCRRSPGAPDWPAFQAEKSGLCAELVPSAPMRGIRELLVELETSGVPAAIASTSPRSWVVPATERLGLARLFRAIVSGDDVAARKPAPDLYLEAARRLAVDPARAVALEDSAPGIAAARAAGMRAVAIPHWLTERHDLSGAHLRVAHAGELTLARLAALLDKL